MLPTSKNTMKTSTRLSAMKAATIAACVLASVTPGYAAKKPKGTPPGNQALIPSAPGGWLTAFPTVVQTGTKPTLTWSINFPSSVVNYTTVDSSDVVTTQDQLDVDIRVIGSGVTTGGGGGGGKTPQSRLTSATVPTT